ncbi:hypothetical protein GMLC_10970 [Geomonas limicola]|uniref:Glycosyltransferase RgtA/B/C/D-like domain-containing protein n=1 Tax=Geomonas limicola TaxID=2740186 RepID=A0A6V8N4L8_9BACT|nr:hypothetical protein [Geomonas limicola]GFO67518.1 hypothetical protein GMLC_10970 [Geomonas limicola]
MTRDQVATPATAETPALRARKIALSVFAATFVVQSVKFLLYLADGEIWGHQLLNLLGWKPGLLDFDGAYGHPGTTLLELAALFHFLGLPDYPSFALGTALLVAALTAACSALCFLLQPRSWWWLATAFLLTFSRFYIDATPPVAVVMPGVTLMALLSCWLWLQEKAVARSFAALLGTLIGILAATRLDVSLFVGGPLFVLFCYRAGRGALLPGLAGGVAAFFAGNPFLWFMPVQHLKDLYWKFSYHYAHYKGSVSLSALEWSFVMPLAALGMLWFLVQLRSPRKEEPLPRPVLLGYLALTLLAVSLLVSSKYQAVRYLYPFVTFWEVLLARFVLELTPDTCTFPLSAARFDKKTALALLGFIIPTQVLGYLWVFKWFGPRP